MLKETIYAQGVLAKKAADEMRNMSVIKRNRALKEMADALRRQENAILMENKKDMGKGRASGLSRAMLDRLLLTGNRIEAMAAGLEQLISLDDPVGSMTKAWKRPNGIEIGVIKVPLGVIGMIYEARPNVTVEAAGLAVKTANTVILKGSSTAHNSNKILVYILDNAARNAGLPDGTIQVIDSLDREAVQVMLTMNDYLNVLIPRGGAGLIETVVKGSTVPVIETGTGNCHAYVDATADLEMALKIVINGKTRRPSVCNTLETCLVEEEMMAEFLPLLALALEKKKVEVRACEKSREFFKDAKLATEEDYATEFLDYILAVKKVKDVNEAIAHINTYGTMHSEVIITDDYENARTFQKGVDAACVYVNASTCFSDGEEFGFGAEIGISTQKLHARGPLGLDALTSIKYVINGDGQIRE